MAYNKDVSLEAKILGGLREFSEALKSGKPVTKQLTCRKAELDLVPEPYNPDLVRQTREVLKVSQGIFAKFLGVNVKTVQKWERGEAEPQMIACRFMDEIRTSPEHWRERLAGCITPKVPA